MEGKRVPILDDEKNVRPALSMDFEYEPAGKTIDLQAGSHPVR